MEGGEDPLLTMAAYIDLNPIRAGMVSDPADYAYSGYGEASVGDPVARRGLALVLEPEGANPVEVRAGRARLPDWREVGRVYRQLLYGIGGERGSRRGFSREEVAAEMAGGGRVEPWKALRCRVRYLCDGAVFGSKAFVEGVFEANRSRYGRTARRARGRCAAATGATSTCSEICRRRSSGRRCRELRSCYQVCGWFSPWPPQARNLFYPVTGIRSFAAIDPTTHGRHSRKA